MCTHSSYLSTKIELITFVGHEIMNERKNLYDVT